MVMNKICNNLAIGDIDKTCIYTLSITASVDDTWYTILSALQSPTSNGITYASLSVNIHAKLNIFNRNVDLDGSVVNANVDVSFPEQ